MLFNLFLRIYKVNIQYTTQFDLNNEAINVNIHIKRFTMDTIWNCAFGIDIDLQKKTNNLYFDKCEAHFRIASEFPFVMHLISKY